LQALLQYFQVQKRVKFVDKRYLEVKPLVTSEFEEHELKCYSNVDETSLSIAMSGGGGKAGPAMTIESSSDDITIVMP